MPKSTKQSAADAERARGDEAIDKVVAIVTRAAQASSESEFDDILEQVRDHASSVPIEQHASLEAWARATRRETFARLAHTRSAESTRAWNEAASALGWAETSGVRPEDVRRFLETMKPLMRDQLLRARVEAVTAHARRRA